jgi:hypothetical protein
MIDVHLLFHAPLGLPGCQLHPGASQDLVATLYLHKQHIDTDTDNVQKYIAKWILHVQLYLPIKYYTKCSSFRPQNICIN